MTRLQNGRLGATPIGPHDRLRNDVERCSPPVLDPHRPFFPRPLPGRLQSSSVGSMRTPRVAVAATLMTLTLLTACGGDESDSSEEVTATVTATPSDSTSPTETSPTTEASVTPMDPTEGDVTQDQLNAALLTPEEVSPGLVLGTWTNEDSPPPCDASAIPVDLQVPPSVEGGVEINTADGNASYEEEIAIYVTEGEASEAFTIGSAGLNCSTAALEDGSTATIGPATDVTAEVNADSGIGNSTAWEITGEGFSGVLIATLAGRIIIANTFVVADGSDTSTLPTPVEIAGLAWTKALAN